MGSWIGMIKDVRVLVNVQLSDGSVVQLEDGVADELEDPADDRDEVRLASGPAYGSVV